MAIQFVGGNTAVKVGATSGNTTISLTTLTGGISASAAIGDIVIAVFSTGSTADRTLAITTGYTLIATELYSNGTSYDTNLRVAYKVLTTADTTVTFGPTLNAQDAGAMAVYVFRGVAGIIFDVTTTTATGTGTGRPTPPAITPVDAGTVIVCVGASAAATGAVFTTATLTSFRTVTSPDTNDAMLGIGYFAWTSGTYTPAQFGGGTTNAADSWAAMSIALQAAQAYSVDVTETVTAIDSQLGGINYTVDDLESNATLNNTMNATAITLTSTGSGNTLVSPGKLGNSFIATQTGHLGNFKIAVYSPNVTLPTTQGAIELWQLASNTITATPTTLLATAPLPYTYVVANTPYGIPKLEFDLSNVSGMSVTAGTGYAIVLKAGSDWTFANSWSLINKSFTSSLYSTWSYNGTSWVNNSSIVFGIELDYQNATLDSQIEDLATTATRTESAPATDTQNAAGNEQVVESVTATDAESTSLTARGYNLESNAALGSAMNGAAYNISSASSFNITSTRKGGSTFIAPVTGQLGNIKAAMASFVFGTTPTANGAIELWQLASNSLTAIPTTLLASFAIPYRNLTFSNSQIVNIEYDLSNVSGMTVTAGTGYAIVFAGGTDWGVSTALWQLLYANAGASLYGAVDSNGGSWATPTAARGASIELNYTNATLDTESATLLSVASVTETGTAADSETARFTTSSAITETVTTTDAENAINLLGAAITETGTATDSETAVSADNAWVNENPVSTNGAFINLLDAYTPTTTAVIAANEVAANRFIANKTAVLGSFAFKARRGNTVRPAPIQPGKIVVWQLASNSLTALPSSELGSITFAISAIDSSSYEGYVFDLSSLNITLTNGVGYAIGYVAPSDSGGSTQYLTVYAVTPLDITQVNNAKIIASGLAGTYPSAYSTAPIIYEYAVQPILNTIDTQIAGFVASSAITETVTTTETETAGIGYNVDDIETVTATETQLATYTPTALITETAPATDSETAVYTAVRTITETATATETETASNLSTSTITETAPATDTETAIVSFKAYDLESNSTLGSTVNGVPYVVGVNGLTAFTVSAVQSSGTTFIATQTGHLGNLKAGMTVAGSGIDPITNGVIQLWQLASNSISAIPTTLLASLSIPYSTVTSSNGIVSIEWDLSNVSGMTVTAGTGYAIVFAGGSDWNVSGHYCWGLRGNLGGISGLYALVIRSSGIWSAPVLTSTVAIELNYTNATLDSQTATVPLTPALITESAPATDSETASALLGANITESAPATETETANNLATADITETAPATETETAVYTPVATITESAPATDTETGGFIAISVITETGTATETEVASFSIASTITETVVALDTETAQAIFSTIIVEAGNATETESAVSTTNSTITETVTADNTQFSTYFVTAAVIETSTLADTQTSILAYTLTITESVSAVVTSVVVANYVASITESVDATDLYVTKGWYRIIDGQTPNWNPINDSQTVVWAAINDGQTPGWVLINNTQTVTWTNIDDAQNPNWTDIDDSQ